MTPAHACIYIPASLAVDAAHVAMCLAYCERRGYWLHAVFRDWAYVEWVLGVGQATVVVLVSSVTEYQAGVQQPAPDPEATCNVTRYLRRWRNVHRGVSPPRLSPSQVRELVDGNGRMPPGLDPATVAAARRIARQLNGAHE